MIKVTDKYAIKSDTNQWMICKYRNPTKRDQGKWMGFKYYSTLNNTLEALRDILLRESSYQSFSELSSNHRDLTSQIEHVFKVAL